MSTGLITPYDFILSQLNFITSNGQAVDLRAIYTSLDIYYDIFANIASGTLTITDSTNIFGHIVSQGSEFIQISLDKPGMNAPINETFRITTRNSGPLSLTNQTVQVSFCSEELMLSKATKFTKSYYGMLISDMVKDIASNILKISSFPSTNIETTTNIHSITIPNYSPFQAMNWLAARATSSYVGATFMFYKTRTGYNFKSLQSLMDISSPKAIYNINVQNVTSKDPNFDFFNVSRYEPIKIPDSLESLMSGKFASQLITLDPLRQKYTISNLNGDDLFKSAVTLGPGKQYNNFEDRLGNQMSTSYKSFRRFFPTNTGQDTSQYIQGKQQINQSNVEKWLLERQALIMQLLSIRIKVVIPGNNSLNVGDIIQLNLPSIEPQVGVDEGSYQRKLDPYYSGNYMITAIRHHLDIKEFETVLELCKDSLAQQLPSATNSNPAVGALT